MQIKLPLPEREHVPLFWHGREAHEFAVVVVAFFFFVVKLVFQTVRKYLRFL